MKSLDEVLKKGKFAEGSVKKEETAMVHGEDVTSPESVSRRRSHFEAFCKRIMSFSMGREISFTSFVEENGKLSEEKAEAFIDELLSGREMSEEMRRFYKCFFYCAIFGPSSRNSCYYLRCFDVDYFPSTTFGDLIYAASDSLFSVKDPVLNAVSEEQERANPDSAGSFAFFLTEVYSELTGKPFYSLYSPEELKAVAEEYAEIRGLNADDVLKEWNDPKKETVTDEAVSEETVSCGEETRSNDENPFPVCFEDVFKNIKTVVLSEEEFAKLETDENDTVDEDTIVLPPPDHDYLAEDMEFYSWLCESSRKKYFDRLPEGHHLAESYLELRGMAFKLPVEDISEEVRSMAESFMIRHGLLPIMSGTFYESTRVLMNQFEKQLAKFSGKKDW